MNIREAITELQNASGIAIGDTVKVLRTAKKDEMGWDASWVAAMTGMVGKTFTVEAISSTGGMSLRSSSYTTFCFPFFVLELISKGLTISKVTTEYAAVVDSSGTSAKIGCQTAQFDKVKELYNAMLKQQGKQ